jgi:tyrosyl-tRNA synthetase
MGCSGRRLVGRVIDEQISARQERAQPASCRPQALNGTLDSHRQASDNPTMTVDEQLQILTHGCDSIYSEKELRKKLEQSAETGRPLRAKLGMDPTAPDIHLGHAVVLAKLRQFQDLGHQAVLIIGDYTARVGDPSGRNATRPMLSPEQIKANAQTYFDQAGRVLDLSSEKLEVRYNSEWLAEMNFADVLRLASKKTVARMLERDTFEKRFKAEQEIGIHELLYPLMQGWDSVCIEADVELGGTDQTFNNLVGRDLQKMEGQQPQIVIIMPILVGLDGAEKMSKSMGNYVGVTEPADGMFGKIMSIPDAGMADYYARLTRVPAEQFTAAIKANPRDAKVALAKAIVTQFHDAPAADKAEREFFAKMKGGLPDDIPELVIPASELEDGRIPAFKLAVLCGFATTNGQARRLIAEGGVRINQQSIKDPNASIEIKTGDIVQRGKRKFVRVNVD